MTAPSDAEPLPDYKNPPVIETVLGVQFDRLRSATNAHFGAFWRNLPRDQWPSVTDAEPLPLQFERFDATARWASAIQFQLTQDPACRVQIKNADKNRMIQVQNGRLHLNWLGTDKESYPRYETVRKEFSDVVQRFAKFAKEEMLGDFCPNQWEVTYVNQIPRGTVWNDPSEWGFFRPLAGLPSLDHIIAGESFGGEWHFIIPQRRGRLHIQWQHGTAAIDGDGPDTNDFVRLTLTARGPIPSGGIEPTLEGLDLGRATIVRSFRDLMSDEANRFWGLKNESHR